MQNHPENNILMFITNTDHKYVVRIILSFECQGHFSILMSIFVTIRKELFYKNNEDNIVILKDQCKYSK